MDGGKTALTLLLLMVLVVIPFNAFESHSARPTGTQRESIMGLQLQSTSVDIVRASLSGPNLAFKAVVYNPFGFGATLYEANYSVYADGRFLGNGQTAHEYDFAPQSTQTLVFPISLGWESAFLTAGHYVLGLGEVTWKVNGTASIGVNGLPLRVTFEFTAD